MSFWLLAVLLASKGCAMASTASVTEPTDIQRLLSRLGFPIARVASDRVPSAALVSARQDWSSLTPDRSCHTHTPIRLGGRTYRKGLGAHSNGIARFALDGSFLRFKCDVGVDNNSDTAGGKGSVQFVVRVDGREIVRTPTCRGGEAARPIEADVTGARDLELVVLDAGDGIAYDQADWADARLVGAGGKTIYLSDVVARAARSSLMQGDALPSSFVLDGEPSDRVLAAWPKKDSTRPAPRGGMVYERAWEQPGGGLRVVWSCRVLPGDRAMEVRWTFTNTGAAPSSVLSDVMALDLRTTAADGRLRLLHSSGGLIGGMDDPDLGFALSNTRLGSATLAGAGGRSSNKDLPFFLLHDETARTGLYIGVGWSGQWQADIGATGGDPVRVRVYMPGVRLRIPPGETIVSPAVLVGTYAGDELDGGNALRRTLHERYVALLDGARPLPPISWNSWFVLENRIDEALLKREADVAARIGLDYFCIDAGWFEGDFPNGVGNWTLNRSKFPNGLKGIGDYVRGKGMKLGLWFEPERAAPSTRLVREHPEWVHRDLVDLGNADCREWIFRMMTGFIDEGGVRWIRFDFNMDPLPVWEAMDTPDTRGLAQIRHIQGLYALLDRLMKRYPDLLIEGCASGGRRIDLQTVQRSHTFWKSDDTARLNVMRFHETGGNALLPGALLNANLLVVSSQYAVHSLFGGPLGFGADLAKLPAKTVEMVRREVARYRGFRRLLNEDYYPLFPQRRDETGWIGWQFHDPAAGEGVAIVLRPADSVYRSAEITLRGLDPAATYEVTRSTSTRKERLTGEALASQVVELAKPASSVVLQYRRVK